MSEIKKFGCENVVWDLTHIYSSYEDLQIESDVKTIESMLEEMKSYRGKVCKNLDVILEKEIILDQLENKVFAYLQLLSSVDSQNQKLKKVIGDYGNRLSQIGAELEFISIEIGEISDEDYARELKKDIVKFHKPHLDEIIKNAKYNLSEDCEKTLTKYGQFMSGPWSDLVGELETRIKFEWNGKKVSFQEITDIFANSSDGAERQKAMEVFVSTLNDKGNGYSFVEMSVKTMNSVLGECAVQRKDRGFLYPMESRNISNMLSKDVVDSLHDVVGKEGVEQTKRYYKILARLLGKNLLSWSDRNAKPFANHTESDGKIMWKDAVEKTLNAYSEFSPKLGEIAKTFFDKKKVHAPVIEGKETGAFSCSFILPNNVEESFVFMNYQGKDRDVATLAHEVGHSIHGILAERKQGSIMHSAPMPYAETASIFGEMLLFESQVKLVDDKQKKLAILMEKCLDWNNSVVRQISFSDFEKTIHSEREKGELLEEDFNDVYLDSTRKFYGDDNEIFDYNLVGSMWAYVSHFHRPFYVYAYAFGELFTQSLFAIKDNFGAGEFEKLYIEMLEKGGTEGAVDLMKPFGISPETREFWVNGVNCSIKKWLDEVEILIEELNL